MGRKAQKDLIEDCGRKLKIGEPRGRQGRSEVKRSIIADGYNVWRHPKVRASLKNETRENKSGVEEPQKAERRKISLTTTKNC